MREREREGEGERGGERGGKRERNFEKEGRAMFGSKMKSKMYFNFFPRLILSLSSFLSLSLSLFLTYSLSSSFLLFSFPSIFVSPLSPFLIPTVLCLKKERERKKQSLWKAEKEREREKERKKGGQCRK